ncbi:dihydrofolate reductase family protein [Arthrobacter sp. TMN-49]
MGRLIYTAITSLDGYVADVDGNFDWSMPNPEVHAYINNLERPIGIYLLGRRLYDVMKVWDTFYGRVDLPPEMVDYATIWQQAQKIIYSTTLSEASAANTRIEANFDPASIRRLKAEAATDLSVGGADLAGQTLNAGLVDQIHLLISPVMVGGGKRALPEGFSTSLELLGQRRFSNGVVHLHYSVENQG